MNGDDKQSVHVSDDAAGYALGMLDDAERARIDDHARTCVACAQALAQAQDDVAVLVAADAHYDAPPDLLRRVADIAQPAPVVALNSRRRSPASQRAWLPYFAAVAAALVAGMLPSAYFYERGVREHAAMVADSQLLNRLATTQFRTASFRGMGEGSTARVMYDPTGQWYVVLVHGASKALQVAWMHDGERTMLGSPHMHGDVAMLYLPRSHRMDQLALVDGQRVVAQAQLVF